MKICFEHIHCCCTPTCHNQISHYAIILCQYENIQTKYHTFALQTLFSIFFVFSNFTPKTPNHENERNCNIAKCEYMYDLLLIVAWRHNLVLNFWMLSFFVVLLLYIEYQNVLKYRHFLYRFYEKNIYSWKIYMFISVVYLNQKPSFNEKWLCADFDHNFIYKVLHQFSINGDKSS